MNQDNSQEKVVNQQEESEQPTAGNGVTFPEVKKKKSFKVAWIFVVIFILGLLAGGYYLFSKPKIVSKETPTPTLSLEKEPLETPTPLQEEIDRSKIVIKVLNGTGISGAAGSLKTKLEDMGYQQIEVGNAKTQDYKVTKVTFDTDVSQGVKDEITQKLVEIYEEVDIDESDLTRISVEIITGYPKGYAPTVTQKPKPTSTVTPTTSATGTITPSPTSTPTPTI